MEKKKKGQKVHNVTGTWDTKKAPKGGEIIYRFRKDYKGIHLNKTGTEKECEEFAIARMREIDLGATVAKKPIFKARWEKFIASLKKKKKAKLVTIEEYDDTIQRYIYPKYEHADIRHMLFSDLDDFFTEFGQKSPAAAYNTLALLKRVFRIAVSDRIILSNPADNIEVRKEVIKKPRTVDENTRNDVKTLLNAFESDIFFLFFVFAYVFGLRRGELLAIKFDDIFIDSDGKTRIHIERQITKVDGEKYNEIKRGWDFSPLKASRPPFDVIVPDNLLPLIEKQKELVSKKLKKRTNVYNLLFPSATGEGYYPSSADGHLRKITKNHNLFKTYINEFRKFSATETAQSDKNAITGDNLVTQQLNHSTNAVNGHYVAPPDPKNLQATFEKNYSNLFEKKDEKKADQAV